MLERTSCEVPDVPAFLPHPTAPHLAAFYLAIARLSFSATLPLRHWCEVLRILTIGTKSKYPPAEPGALEYEPLEAASGITERSRAAHPQLIGGLLFSQIEPRRHTRTASPRFRELVS